MNWEVRELAVVVAITDSLTNALSSIRQGTWSGWSITLGDVIGTLGGSEPREDVLVGQMSRSWPLLQVWKGHRHDK
jgi:hypothetical protein